MYNGHVLILAAEIFNEKVEGFQNQVLEPLIKIYHVNSLTK